MMFCQNDYYFTDKLFGKEFTFQPKSNEVLVKFNEHLPESVIVEIAGQNNLFLIFKDLMDSTITIFSFPDSLSYESIASTLILNDSIAGCIPVLIDQDGYEQYILPDRFIVQFVDSIYDETASDIIADWDCSIIKKHWTPGYYTLSVPPDITVFGVVRQIMQHPAVKFSEPVYVNNVNHYGDPLLNNMWHLLNTGQKAGYTEGNDINVFPAWNITYGDTNVIIVVIDDGIDWTHEDLQGNILPVGDEDWDFSSDGKLPMGTPDWHGTRVSGVAAAVMNDIGIRGVAPNCRLMPLKAISSDEKADAINYAVSRRSYHTRIVINGSWGTGSTEHTGIHNAVLNAFNNNVPCIFASGNYNQPWVAYPARYMETIAVGGISPCDSKRYHCEWCYAGLCLKCVARHPITGDCQQWDGDYFGSSYGEELDISAPSEGIYTTYGGNKYVDSAKGTSFAAPQVSGVVGLLLSVNPNLSVNDIRSILQNTADKVGGYNYNWNPSKPGHSKELGYGRVDAYYAVLAAITPSLSFPSNCAILSNAPTLSWDSLGTGTTYRLQVATNNNFTNPFIDSSGITATSFPLIGLSVATTYYWRVSAFTINGTTYWSDVRYFGITPPPASQLTGTTVRREFMGEMLASPELTWTFSNWCDVLYSLYKYVCIGNCEDTIGTCIYSGPATSYIDSSWISGNDTDRTVYYYVKASAEGQSSYSNKVSYGSGYYFDPEKRGQFAESDKSKNELLHKVSLSENYPDPFNPQTIIHFSLPEPMYVKLVIFDVLGRAMEVLVDRIEGAGLKSVVWNANNVPSGMYYYRLQAHSIDGNKSNNFTGVKKMLLLR